LRGWREEKERPRIEWEEHMWKKMKTLLEATRLVKERKVFKIWLMNPNA
jgi:hypothetical protein